MEATTRAPGRIAALALLLAATVVPDRPAAADELPVEVPPVVFILLDTSGSMEYDVTGAVAETGDLDLPAIPSCAGPTYGKSRFIVAQEVLTGSFAPYSCTVDNRTIPASREDAGYPIPHIKVGSSASQLPNGLLDVVTDRFKFGVMTFDTVPTATADAAGGWSYGPETPVNLGARNPLSHNGPLIEPAASNDPNDIRTRNTQVQESILTAMPFGGTPLGPMLRDAYYWFSSDPDILPFNGTTGDVYANCRSKNILLITDGKANQGEGTDGYLTAAAYAYRLFQDLDVKVYVVGFQLAAGVDTQVNAIADKGGTGSAYFANNQSELIETLIRIIGSLEVVTQSRSRTVVTEDTGNTTDRQYELSAGYSMVPGVLGLRRGHIERAVFQCAGSSDVATIQDYQVLSNRLNAASDASRTVLTQVAGALTPFAENNALLTSDAMSIPDSPSAWLMDFRRTVGGQCGTGVLGVSSDATVRSTFRETLIRYIRGTSDSCRAGFRTGAVVHATPVIQGHLKNVDVNIPSFKLFKQSATVVNRPTTMYVGTHDGQMHAFELDRATAGDTTNWGRELWSFIPNHLLRQLKDLPAAYRPLMDGPPVVKDILMTRTAVSLAAPATEALNWKTVLVSGYRDGGRGYFALDVTNPESPQFLWEISNEGRCAPGGPCPPSGDTSFSRLGWSYSRPEIGVVYVDPSGAAGDEQELAVAVFGGGSGEGLSGGDTGRSVYVVRLDNGTLVRRIDPAAQPFGCSWPVGGADLVGNVACYSTFQGTFISRCYLGDSAGRLWRVDLGNADPSKWRLELFYDPYAGVTSATIPVVSAVRAPVWEAPAIAVTAFTSELAIVWGGADTDSIDELVHRNFVASVTETLDPGFTACSPFTDAPCAYTDPFTGTARQSAKLNWKRFLGFDQGLNLHQWYEDPAVPGERMMGQPLVYSGSAYWATFTPNALDKCDPGRGRLYGVDATIKDGNSCQDLQGRLSAAVTSDEESISLGTSIPYGVTIVTRPACPQMEDPNNTTPGSTTDKALFGLTNQEPQIVVQTAVQSARTPNTLPPATGGNTVIPDIAKASLSIRAAVQSMFVSSWGFVFD